MGKEAHWKKVVGGILRYAIASISFSIMLYVVFALVFSTDEERQLEHENRLYRERFAEMQAQQQLIGDVVEGLMERDDAIYEGLFETSAPSPDATTAADLIAASDSLSESFYLSAAASASESLMLMAGNVDESFAEIFRLLETRRDSIPPLTLPLKGMSYVQAGASVGQKDNPVYQLPMQHDGIDFIAPQGDPVYAVADGLVTEVGAGTASVRGGRRGRDPPGGGVPSPLARTIPGRIARPRSPPSGPWEMRGASEGGEGEVCAVGSAAVSRPSREVLRQIRGSPCGRALEPEPTGGCGRGGRLGPVGRTPTPLARPEAEP